MTKTFTLVKNGKWCWCELTHDDLPKSITGVVINGAWPLQYFPDIKSMFCPGPQQIIANEVEFVWYGEVPKEFPNMRGTRDYNDVIANFFESGEYKKHAGYRP